MRRFALVVAVVLVALAGVAAVLATRPSRSAAHVPLATARFRGGISLRYPAAWTRSDWCQGGMHVQPIGLLTSAHPGPKCKPRASSVSWPPSERLGANDVAVSLAAEGPPMWHISEFQSNARIGGRPAFLSKPGYGTCPGGQKGEGLAVEIVPPGWTGGFLLGQASICGPDLAANEAAVRDLFTSIRFSRSR